MGFHVDSEAGRLRRVILHRPDLELKRLTPSNKDALLFDDVLWVRRARAEHDGFADVLRDRGVAVHLFGDLLTDVMSIPRARELVLDRVFDEKEYGPLATDHLRAAFESLPVTELVEALIGGMTKREFLDAHMGKPRSASMSWSWTNSFSTPSPTTSSPVTPPPGSTTGSPSTPCAGPPVSARPSTSRRSTGTIPSFVTRRSMSGRRGRPTIRPPSRAATSSSSATAPS